MLLRHIALALAWAFSQASCSFIAIQRAPAQVAASEPLECTDSLVYPLIDMSATVLAGVLTVSLLSSDNSEDDFPTSGVAVGALALAVASSAVYGVYQVNRCRPAQAAWEEAAPTQGPTTNERAAGSQGGRCLGNGTCDEDLKCDTPMQVCVPDDPSEF